MNMENETEGGSPAGGSSLRVNGLLNVYAAGAAVEISAERLAELNRIPLSASALLNRSTISSRSMDFTPINPFLDEEYLKACQAEEAARKSSSKRKKSKKSSKSSKKSASTTKAQSTKTKGGRRTKATTPKSLNDLDPDALLVGQVTDDVYVVEKICDRKTFDGVDKYWVKWKGWGTAHNTWEPIENLDGCSELLRKFHEAQDKQEITSKSGKGSKSKGKGEATTSTEPEPSASAKRDEPIVATPSASGSSVGDDIDLDFEDDAPVEVDDADPEGELEFRVLDKWPSDKVPRRVLSVQVIDREICYIIWCFSSMEGGLAAAMARAAAEPYAQPDCKDVVIINGACFKKVFPHVLINYYEAAFHWKTNMNDNDDLAKKAAMCINQKLHLEKLEQKKASLLRDCKEKDTEEANEQKTALNEALNDIKNKTGIADTELISSDEKMEIGSDDEKNKSDSSDDDMPQIRVRAITDKEVFEDEFGLPADMSSSEDEERLVRAEDSSDEEDYMDISDRFLKKDDNTLADHVVV